LSAHRQRRPPHVEEEHGPGGTRVIIQDAPGRIWGPRARTYSPTIISAHTLADLAARERIASTTMPPDEGTLPPLPALHDDIEPPAPPRRPSARQPLRRRDSWARLALVVLPILTPALAGAGLALLAAAHWS
jgi:hypothetical protein